MANPVELSHYSRTEIDHVAALDVATEFAELIDDHRKLSHDYAALLAQFPGPIPDPLPAVPVQSKNGTVRWVAVKVTKRHPRRLPEPEQALYAEGEARRCSLLAVHQPFVRVYWRPDDAGPAHRAANEWRARVSAAMKRLLRLYRSLDRRAQLDPEARLLHDFPLLRADGAGGGIWGAEILEAIETHIEHLTDDLSNWEPKAGSHSALSDGIGARLRAARKRKGDKQQIVAGRFHCDVATISRIETGKQRADQYNSQIEEYIQQPSK